MVVILLSRSAVGDTDGLIKGKRYFTCPSKHGKLVRISNVIAVLPNKVRLMKVAIDIFISPLLIQTISRLYKSLESMVPLFYNSDSLFSMGYKLNIRHGGL